MGILELNEDGGAGGSGGSKVFVAERFFVGEPGRDTDDEGVGDRSEDVDVDTGEEENKK